MRTAIVLSLWLCACATQAPQDPEAPAAPAAPLAIDLAALLAAPDRSEADRALDPGRKPAELLAFAEIVPGLKVAELAAGGGYTAELLMRAVGPTGQVYGQNSAFILERFAAGPWAERLAKPINNEIVRVDREFDDPLPPEAQGLDRVLLVLFYHDTVWMKTDRARMNAAIFRALKPGGLYVVVDHSGRAGTGVSEAETLHRIEEQIVRDEVSSAGFVLVGEGDFLREPGDPRDWNASPRQAGERRGTSDRFVLKFKKP